MNAINELKKVIHNLAQKNAFSEDVIQVFRDDDNSISIEINGKDWATQNNYEEAECCIYDLFKGIELGAKNMRSKYVFK